MSELLQWSAAIVVLAAFALSQRGIWAVTSYSYLSLNFVGGAGLSAAAALSHQWGFVLLEGVWALVAAWGVSTRLRSRAHRIPVG
jgi:hypothetical protein